jgi:hypothetical protein
LLSSDLMDLPTNIIFVPRIYYQKENNIGVSGAPEC